jgi:serine protease Do
MKQEVFSMYENNDPNTENNESSTYRYTPERGTQSDYTAGAHNADSQYSSGPQSGCIPGSYSPEPPKKKKKLSAGKIIAIALACALLGGCLGVGATLLLRNNTENQTPSTGTTMYVGERQTEKVNTARTDTSEKLTPREVYAQNVNSTVGITTSITTNYWGYQTTSAASGSGFILTEDGYILTNYHVIENSSSVQVTTYDNTAYSASIVGYDKSNDIAVLKIDAAGLTPVVLGSSDDLYVGDEVMAIGNPLGELTFSLTVGYVSALDREVTLSSGTTMDLIQTDAAINSGNSGGALFNSYGEVVGITNAKYSSSSSSGSASIDNIGFAIPINHVKNIITSIIEKGYIVKPYIGVSVTTVSSEMVSYGLPQGAAVKAVSENSPAAECGLKINDIITAINGEEITTSSELVKIVSASQPGDEMTLTVYRQGESEQLTLTLTVGEQQRSALADPTSSSNQQQSSGSYGGFPFGFGYGYGG